MIPGSWKPGFNTNEALNLCAVCANINGWVANAPQPPLPEDWIKVATITGGIYNSEAWLLRSDHHNPDLTPRFCIAFRGATDNPLSIIETSDLKMVPAHGYANHDQAAIHRGFKLSFESLLPELQTFLEPTLLMAEAANERALFYVTGHSQGAALAALFTAWVRCSWPQYAPYMRIKSYYFAQPKPGNHYFANDFHERHCFANAAGSSWAYRISNDQDFVPQLPLTIEVPEDVNPRLRVFEKSPAFPPIMRDFIGAIERLKLPLAGTQNFAGVGTLVALKGKRDPNKDPDDFFYQHHCGRYWELLCNQLVRAKEAPVCI